MKHKISKLKVKGGVDANRMLLKKLVRNFIASGEVKTTLTKAKYLVSTMQTLVSKAQKNDHASLNVILPYLNDSALMTAFVSEVKDRVGSKPASGSVKLQKLGQRFGDAADVARVIWTHEKPKVEKVVAKKS